MIAAATNPAPGTSWFNWLHLFDVLLVLILAFGFWRGRKHGMSREFLRVTMWLSIVIAAGFGKTFGERTAAYISAYLLIAGTVALVFLVIRSKFNKKLEGSNAFGSGEYY